MRQFLAVATASLAAALVPTVAITYRFFVLDGDNPNPIWPMVAGITVIVSLAHTLLPGLIAAGWLLRAGRFRVRPMLFAGVVIGIIPAAIWQHPWRHSGTQSSSRAGAVQTVDNAALTLAGWIDYFQFTGCAGILGAMGAMAFYYVYKAMSPVDSITPTPPDGTV